MRVDFHFNVEHRLQYACRVVRRARAADCRVLLFSRDADRLARLDTALIQREEAVLFRQEPVGLPLAAAAAVAQALLSERAVEAADPFSRRDGWRLYGLV